MAVTRRFGDKPLQVVAEPRLRERIESIAEKDEVSMASVIRDILWDGIEKREQKAGTTDGDE